MRKDYIPKDILYTFISALNESDSETLSITEMRDFLSEAVEN